MISPDQTWYPKASRNGVVYGKWWVPRHITKIIQRDDGDDWVEYYEYLDSDRDICCSVGIFAGWIIASTAVLAVNPTFRFHNRSPLAYEVKIEDCEDYILFPEIIQWIDENVDCKWHLSSGWTGADRMLITPSSFNPMVYSVSFDDLPTATLFRLRF
jgi:hypothetical protein